MQSAIMQQLIVSPQKETQKAATNSEQIAASSNEELLRKWAEIAALLSFREIPNYPSALDYAKSFKLIVCGGIVWRTLRGNVERAPDVDFIATSQQTYDAAIAAIGGSYSQTAFGGARLTWKLKRTDYNGNPLIEHIDIFYVEPPKLMKTIQEFSIGKRVCWSTDGLLLDFDTVNKSTTKEILREQATNAKTRNYSVAP